MEKDDIYDLLLDAVWITRWTDNKQALYAVLSPEEAQKMVDDILATLDANGLKIDKK